MTMKEKIAELEAQGYIKNDTYEIYENVDGGWTIQVFKNSISFEEYNFNNEGDLIDAWEIDTDTKSKKIF